MKETAKLFLKEILIVVIGVVAGVAALAATYFIPQEKMKENAWESAILMHREGLGSFMWPTVKMTQLDGYTDGVMLNTAYTETDDGIRDILLDTRKQRVSGGDLRKILARVSDSLAAASLLF